MGYYRLPGFLLIAGTLLTILSSSPALGATVVVDASTATSSYGEPCSTLVKCDLRARLGCHNEFCDCIRPNEMVYDTEAKKCVSKSGESCIVAEKNVEDNNYIFHVMGCVPNANCSSAGTCECGSRFFENSNGTCSPALGHRETCQSESQCSKYQHLHCQDGICQCDESVAIYSNDSGHSEEEEPTCVGLAQKPCINSACTENAFCSESTCNCTTRFYPNEKGLCVPKIKPMGKCTESSQCEQAPGQELLCIDGICNCNPKVSIYSVSQVTRRSSSKSSRSKSSKSRYNSYNSREDESLLQCVGLVNSSCIDGKCTTNAFCSFDAYSDDRGVCECSSDFTPTRSRTCASGYSSRCSTSLTCLDDLVCRNSECRCKYNRQSFNEETQTCMSVVGGPCKNDDSCKENAECELLSNGSGVGHCICKDGFTEDFSGDCKADYGTTCLAASDCDATAELVCIDQKCNCPTFSEYNGEVRKCVGLVGAKCDFKEENVCTGNAFCNPGKSRKLQGSCTCLPKFQETSNYTCVQYN